MSDSTDIGHFHCCRKLYWAELLKIKGYNKSIIITKEITIMAQFQDILHYEIPNHPEDQFKFNSLYNGFHSTIKKNSQETYF